MGALDFEPQGVDGDEEPVQPTTNVSLSVSGEELQARSKKMEGYRSSEAKTKLAEDTLRGMYDKMDPEGQAEYNKRKKHYAEANVGIYDPLKYEDELVNSLTDGTIPGLDKATYDEARAAQLGKTIEDLRIAQGNTEGNWTDEFMGSMGAVLEDPLEQKLIVASLPLGLLSAGRTVAFKLGALGLESAASAGAIYSYQQEIIDLYKELDLEEHYGERDKWTNVGFAAGMPVVGAAVGKGIELAVKGTMTGIGRLTENEIEKYIRIKAKHAKAGGDVRADVPEEVLSSIDQTIRDMAAGGPKGTESHLEHIVRISDAMAELGKEYGPVKTPPIPGKPLAVSTASILEIGAGNKGVVNVNASVAAAVKQLGKKFTQSTARKQIAKEMEQQFIKDMERQIANVPMPDTNAVVRNSAEAVRIRGEVYKLSDEVAKLKKRNVAAKKAVARKKGKPGADGTLRKQVASASKQPATLAPEKAAIAAAKTQRLKDASSELQFLMSLPREVLVNDATHSKALGRIMKELEVPKAKAEIDDAATVAARTQAIDDLDNLIAGHKRKIDSLDLNAKMNAKKAVIQKQLDEFRKSGKLAGDYKEILDAQVKLAADEHKLRAKGKISPADQAKASRFLQSQGIIEDGSPPKLLPVQKSMEEGATGSNYRMPEPVQQALDDIDAGPADATITINVDPASNSGITKSAREVASMRRDMQTIIEATRACNL